MSPILIGAVVTILLAALFYTIAVFSERRSGVLKPAHVWLFWVGLLFDTIGTTLMSEIAGGWKFDIHGILGVAAIVLMLVHAGWATFAIWQRNEAVLHSFHRFSLGVWSLWMVSLLTGFGLAIPRMLAEKAVGA